MFSYNLLFVPFFINKEYSSNYLKNLSNKMHWFMRESCMRKTIRISFLFNGQVFENTKKYVFVYVYLYMYNLSRTLYLLLN